MKNILDLTIREASDLLSSKQLKAQELALAFLKSTHGLNKKLNSFITICDDVALNQAKKVDELIANGQKLNPLAGIPIGIKDIFSTKGVKTTAGSKVLESYVPIYDATSVDRLKNAGVSII